MFNAGIRVIVPYFADADASNGGVRLNTTGGTNMLVSLGSRYEGAPPDSDQFNQWPVAFFADGVGPTSSLELNYDNVRWEAGISDGGTAGLGGIEPRIGFSDGFGRTYEVPGSGTNGMLLGLAGQDCPANSLSVACNDYDFRFIKGLRYRNGVPIFPAQVPEPATAALLLTGLAVPVLRLSRRRAR